MYLTNNREALDQIMPKLQEDATYRFDGELGEIQDVWMEFVQGRRELERAYQDSNRAVEAETKLAAKSIMTDRAVDNLEGEVAVTEMLVMIRSTEGEEKPYNVTLQKYELAPNADARAEPSRWIIVGIEEQAPT